MKKLILAISLFIVTAVGVVIADGGPIPFCRPDCEQMNPVPRCCHAR